ncbi:single-stranded-DNA-specific exonuclease RecJ [Candidatus Pelagibacter communis]|uniref:single-stranded-DNA-specific exonuclease RecJ n=1 Tax=Pelagibacter ubique TaxID=198252 RepID=UPI00094D9E4E|nr:single-stranded-DNA-specific exonuclease RecJ [Candidatus Pelagibacter ubique]
MISVSGREWKEEKVNKRILEKIEQEYNFSKIVSKLIVSRNFDKEEIYSINNNLKLSNFFQNNSDFIDSVKIVEKLIKHKEKICIFGDYDVDGSASTSLLVNFFQSISHPFFYYIPDRVKDGYGASVKIFKKIILKKPKLVIMVDCGSTNNEAINYLNQNNIKSLIIDHHEINKPYPKADVIINPKKNNGYLEYDYLCATTLTYFFLEMLNKKMKCKMDLKKYLINVLLATVCDVMPLRKLNRLIAKKVINEFKINENKAFKELYELNNRKNKISINDLGYLIGPILNAGGRLGKSNYATELLSSENQNLINKRSLELINLNNKRKKIENITLKNIDLDMLKNQNDNIIVYYNPNINEGLIGIIASRLKDYFNKPSIVITNSNDILKGSARSIYKYNLGRVIKLSLDRNLIINGGGHNMAAGFSLKKENLSNFKSFVNKDFLKNYIFSNNVYMYDFEASSSALNKEFYKDLQQIGPFGTGNPLPTFLFKDFKILKSSILNEKHVSCILKSNKGIAINSIAFNSSNSEIGKYLLNYKKNLNVLGQISENFWNNKKTLQLIIKDLVL